MKRLLLLTAVAATTLTQAAHADGDISIRFNGNPLTAEQPPVVVNDRTLVPVRAVCEAMG
ncbi:MAG: copper amine oxidase, partial [Clostridia bacterium]|nr:copper amine oxidase [Clostridia bacterium]